MSGKQAAGSKNSGNLTGKNGNASGSDVKEARGPSYKERDGKHPPNKLYTGPKNASTKK
jgi:hypothetical protein